jgi:hypothetical protein
LLPEILSADAFDSFDATGTGDGLENEETAREVALGKEFPCLINKELYTVFLGNELFIFAIRK